MSTRLHIRTIAFTAGFVCAASSGPALAEVSWLDLLQNPDDVALNEQFVTERLAAGDLPAALSAVERVIAANPGDVPLRLLRAEILVNLANDTLAIGELDALDQLPLLPDQRKMVSNLRKVIEARAKRWHTVAAATLGITGSDNANKYPSSGLMDFQLTPTSTPSTREYESTGGATKTIREVAATSSLSVSSSYEFANQDRDTVMVGASQSENRGKKYHYLTSGTTSVFAGANMKLGGLQIQPLIRLNEIKSKTSADSTIAIGSLTAGKKLFSSLQTYATAEYSIVNQIPSSSFVTANQNDGHSRTFKLGASASLIPEITVFAQGTYGAFNPMETRYNAMTTAYLLSHGNANRSKSGTIGIAGSPTKYSRLTASVTATDTKYPNMENTSRKFRQDDQTRTALGLQLAGGMFGETMQNFSFALNASQTKNDSNIKQYDYKKSDVSLTMRYRLID